MEKSKISEWQIIEGFVGLLTITNKPQNFLIEPEFVDLDQLREWITNSGIKGLIIAGAGRHFCGGADVQGIFKMAERSSKEMEKKLSRGKELLEYIENLTIPTISAIQGCCFGGGLEIALACHIRVAAENSVFAFPETMLKLIPGLGGNFRLMKKCGIAKATSIILTGETMDAQTAFDINLIDYLVPKKETLEFSVQLMKKMIKDKPMEVIQSVMLLLNKSRYFPMENLMEEETRLFSKLALNFIQTMKF